MNSNLDESGISLPVFPSRTNLKLHDISVTSKMVRKVVINLLGLTFSSKLDCGSYIIYIISIAKTASKEIEALVRCMRFLSLEFVLYLYKSTIHPCMEYCCHVWAGAPSWYLELLDK